jgi:D-beta-D-heptose 7-phosphate kinase / D-beta-D-heptose 1-phosphate adenosyltransferase
MTTLPSFHSAHILVIGDVMLDRYWYGNASRISPEAPVPVVHIQQQTERPGGAANVALNLAALQSQTTLIGLVGDDAHADTIQTQLREHYIDCQFIRMAEQPTITKLRVLSRHQQLIRLDFEQSFTPAQSQHIVQQSVDYFDHVNAIILSDYGKGTLSDPQSLIQAAKQARKLIFIDPKGTDFYKYRGATILTPNRSEFEAVVGPCADDEMLVRKGEQLRQELALEALLITRSEQGMTLLREKHSAVHLPAHAHDVFDVTGAGDTVIAVLAAARATGCDWVQATALANVAAGLSVTKLGASSVGYDELAYAINAHRGDQLSLTALSAAVRAAKAKGEIVVMTNGCFDILHAGHVQYLTQARQLGDRLIVAINDDHSVRRLKGKYRPIHALEQRIEVLNALSCVDWVIPFSSDTPRDLICEIKPDILVKGGDYKVEDIAGSDCVLNHGGQVQILNFVEGCSTTAAVTTLMREIEADKQ